MTPGRPTLPAKRVRYGDADRLRPPDGRREHPNLERPGAHPATGTTARKTSATAAFSERR